MSHNFSIPKPILAVPYGCCAGGANPCCACVCSVLEYIVSANLTIITPPLLNVNYKLTFVENITVSAIIAGLCLCSREFRLVRNVSSRAIFVALGFA